jgi:hypothetical protein
MNTSRRSFPGTAALIGTGKAAGTASPINIFAPVVLRAIMEQWSVAESG